MKDISDLLGRIVKDPLHVEKYEKMHGPIRKSEGGGPMMPMNFGGPTAQA